MNARIHSALSIDPSALRLAPESHESERHSVSTVEQCFPIGRTNPQLALPPLIRTSTRRAVRAMTQRLLTGPRQQHPNKMHPLRVPRRDRRTQGVGSA